MSKLEPNDFYPTPGWVTQAILEREFLPGKILEPACGDGAICIELAKSGYVPGVDFSASDLIDRGYGAVQDFLTTDVSYDTIITNPPFKLANEFVKKGYALSREKLIMLLRIQFLEGQKRKKEIFDVIPPSKIYVFSKRITMYPHGRRTAGSGTMCFGWFVWDKKITEQTKVYWV